VTLTLQQPPSLRPYQLEKLYESLFQTMIQTLSLPSTCHIDVWMTTNATIRHYNRQYRKKDYATDVLSFPQFDHLPAASGSLPIPLGQLIISYQKAKQQAKQLGHSELREFSFLFVHGVLHCLGYDHQTPQEETLMMALQEKILGKRVTL
jgi:probable rRNA maturation factor